MTLESLIEGIGAERARADSGQPAAVPDAFLDVALRALEAARVAHAAGDLEGETSALAPLAHQISDSWPFASTLGAEILEYVQARRRRQVRAG